MIKQLLASVGILIMSSALAVVPAYALSGPDFANFGYPKILASENITVGHAATLKSGDITINVPAGAFSDPVTFDLLGGQNTTFQPLVPKNKVVVANFAFRVTDLTTKQLIAKFNAPVIAIITNNRINLSSQYLDTTPSSPITVVSNPVAPTINGYTLKHGNLGAPVGWIVTSPYVTAAQVTTNTVSYSTPVGFYVAAFMVVLILIAIVVYLVKKNSNQPPVA